MTKVYATHLAIIRESIAAIERYGSADRLAFLADQLTQDAVLMRLRVIGEHLAGMRRIDENRFAELADDAWYQVIGLRNVISHGYETVDRERIWTMITDELPDFAATIDAAADAIE